MRGFGFFKGKFISLFTLLAVAISSRKLIESMAAITVATLVLPSDWHNPTRCHTNS